MSNDFVFPQDGDFDDAANFSEALSASVLDNEGIIKGINASNSTTTADTFSPDSGSIQRLRYNSDGSKIYLRDNFSNLYQYNLTSPYTLNGSDTTNDGSISPNQQYLRDLEFNDDYDVLWLLITDSNDDNAKIERHELSTAEDITTASYIRTMDIETEINSPSGSPPGGFRLVDGGSKLYIGDANSAIVQFDLSTADDISSRTKSKEVQLDQLSGSNVGGGESVHFDFNPNGASLIALFDDSGIAELQKFNFGTNFDLDTLSAGNSQTGIELPDGTGIEAANRGAFDINRDGKIMTFNDSTDEDPHNFGVGESYTVGNVRGETFELSSGLALVGDSSFVAKQSGETRSESISYIAELQNKLYQPWDDTTDNYVFLKLDPSTDDSAEIVTKTTDSAPNSTSFKIAEIDSSGSVTDVKFNFDIDGRWTLRNESFSGTSTDATSTVTDIEEFVSKMSGRILNSTNEIADFNFPRTASWRAADGSYVQFSNMDSSMDFRIDRVGNNGLNYRFVDLSVTANDINDIATAITGDGQRMGQNTNWAFAANGNVMGYTGGSEIEVGEWSSESPVSGYDWQNVEGSANDVWIATGYDSANTAYTIIRSTGGFSGPDGWTEVTTPSSATSHNAIASDGNGNWVIALDGGEYIYSTDQGQTWTSNNLSTSDDLLAATYNPTINDADGDQFFIGGQSGRWVQVQTDGSLLDSNSDVLGNANNITSLACKPWNESGQLLVGDSQGNVFYTHNPNDGASANFYGTGNESGTAGKIKSITYASEDYVAIDEFDDHFHIDGDALKMRYVYSDIAVEGIDANNAGLAVSVGGGGRLQISADEDTSTHARIPRLIDSETAQWMVDAGA